MAEGVGESYTKGYGPLEDKFSGVVSLVSFVRERFIESIKYDLDVCVVKWPKSRSFNPSNFCGRET